MIDIAFLFLSLAAAPLAQDAPAPQSQDGITVSGKKTDEKRKKKVCKRSVQTGSIMQKTTCKTVAEWEYQRERSLTALERARKEAEAEQHVRDIRNAGS